MENLIKQLIEASTQEEYQIASRACLDYLPKAAQEERDEIKKAMLKKADILMSQAIETRQKTVELIAELENKEITLEIDGRKYSLTEWVTLKEYCRRFGLKNTMVVNNWISREIVPSENILNIPQLNNLRLIKAVPYKS